MGGATSMMLVIRNAFSQQALSGLIPSIGRCSVIGCKFQVPALYTHNTVIMRAVGLVVSFIVVVTAFFCIFLTFIL